MLLVFPAVFWQRSEYYPYGCSIIHWEFTLLISTPAFYASNIFRCCIFGLPSCILRHRKECRLEIMIEEEVAVVAAAVQADYEWTRAYHNLDRMAKVLSEKK